MSNASFALGVATEIIRILFLSGYGMVNFVFGVAVYFSALFYLVNGIIFWIRVGFFSFYFREPKIIY